MLALSLAALCHAACRFVTVLVSNSSGWIADGLANSGTLTMTQTRKLLQVVGSVGPGERGPWRNCDLRRPCKMLRMRHVGTCHTCATCAGRISKFGSMDSPVTFLHSVC